MDRDDHRLMKIGTKGQTGPGPQPIKPGTINQTCKALGSWAKRNPSPFAPRSRNFRPKNANQS